MSRRGVGVCVPVQSVDRRPPEVDDIIQRVTPTLICLLHINKKTVKFSVVLQRAEIEGIWVRSCPASNTKNDAKCAVVLWQ